MRKLFAVTALFMLAGCGFQLRGVSTLPFDTLYIDGSGNPAMAGEVSRAIRAGSQTQLMDKAADAQAVLQLQAATQEKRILALSGAGRVREYQLIYRVKFRLFDKEGRSLTPNQPIELRRDMTYDDTQVLAKQQEELLLFTDMQKDALVQLMRRIAAAKPQPDFVEDAGQRPQGR